MRVRPLFRQIPSSIDKELIAVFHAQQRVYRRLDGRQRHRRRNRQSQMVRALLETTSSSGFWKLTDYPERLMRWVLRMLYLISRHTQESIGWRVGYSQSYVSRILNPADTTLTLYPSQYRRWLAVFLTPSDLALFD